MSENAHIQVTHLLGRLQGGHGSAAAELLPLVYEELRSLAHARMARESQDHTLQPTALVHEAYLRLVGDENVQWQSRGHFFGAAAEAMRRILVERARRKVAVKHGGQRTRLALDDLPNHWQEPQPADMLRLNQAMEELARRDRRLNEVVMLRYFAGLTLQQTADVMNVALATVKRDWAYARAWLFDHINRSADF